MDNNKDDNEFKYEIKFEHILTSQISFGSSGLFQLIKVRRQNWKHHIENLERSRYVLQLLNQKVFLNEQYVLNCLPKQQQRNYIQGNQDQAQFKRHQKFAISKIVKQLPKQHISYLEQSYRKQQKKKSFHEQYYNDCEQLMYKQNKKKAQRQTEQPQEKIFKQIRKKYLQNILNLIIKTKQQQEQDLTDFTDYKFGSSKESTFQQSNHQVQKELSKDLQEDEQQHQEDEQYQSSSQEQIPCWMLEQI